jgi:hypothetical protein
MSENLEQQAEELEALISIYEGDNYFKQLNSTTFQYKVVKVFLKLKNLTAMILFLVWR